MIYYLCKVDTPFALERSLENDKGKLTGVTYRQKSTERLAAATLATLKVVFKSVKPQPAQLNPRFGGSAGCTIAYLIHRREK